jgi:hypothetical protein
MCAPRVADNDPVRSTGHHHASRTRSSGVSARAATSSSPSRCPATSTADRCATTSGESLGTRESARRRAQRWPCVERTRRDRRHKSHPRTAVTTARNSLDTFRFEDRTVLAASLGALGAGEFEAASSGSGSSTSGRSSPMALGNLATSDRDMLIRATSPHRLGSPVDDRSPHPLGGAEPEPAQPGVRDGDLNREDRQPQADTRRG